LDSIIARALLVADFIDTIGHLQTFSTAWPTSAFHPKADI